MREQITHLLNEIDTVSMQFQATFSALSREQLNWKPEPETWSIAQNIDHLMVVNETYFPIIEQIKEGRYPLPITAKIPYLPNLFARLIYNAVQPTRKRKTITSKNWEPMVTEFDREIIPRFIDYQLKLKHMIEEAEDLLKNRQIIVSPANNYIVYPMDKAFDIIIAHEKRHFNQAMEVKRLLDV